MSKYRINQNYYNFSIASDVAKEYFLLYLCITTSRILLVTLITLEGQVTKGICIDLT